MSNTPITAPRYDRRTIRYHWITAVLVAFMWAGAHAIDWFAKGPPRVDARSVHIVVGLALLAIVVARLTWRFTGGARLPALPGAGGLLARVVHVLLYAILFTTLVLGIANAWIRGDNLFGIAKIPAFGSFDAASRHALSERVVGYHELAANLLLILAGGHAVMALVHRFVLRDDVLSRMLPQRR